MKIVEKIKDVVEHTTDSWQQKLLNEYSHADEPATRARKIIGELVRPLDKPNQVIINDIVSLIYALASNPDPDVDINQVVTTGQLLIHELVEPIPNPDKRLMDELLNIVVHAAHAPHRAAQKAALTASASNPATQAQPAPPQKPAATPTAPQPESPAAPKPANLDPSMIKLIMDEMKEVIKKNQLTEQRISEVENKLSGRISTTYDDIQAIKDKLKKQEADLESINKNMDKFISLYEIVINQYNPFIEHLDDGKKKEAPAQNPPAPQNVTVPPQPKKAAKAPAPAPDVVDAIDSAGDHDNFAFLINEVKQMDEAEFAKSKEKIQKWIKSVLKDESLAASYAAAASQADAVKLLLKRSIQVG